MAVKLRLRRMGKRKKPFYRIVAADSRVSRNGKYIDKIGHYNPVVNPPEIVVDEQKALLWLGRGAIPTDTVKSLLSKKGVMLKWHMTKRGFPDEKMDEEMKKWEVLQLERQRREQALRIQQEMEEPELTDKKEEVEEKAEVEKKVKENEVVSEEITEQPEEVPELSVESDSEDQAL